MFQSLDRRSPSTTVKCINCALCILNVSIAQSRPAPLQHRERSDGRRMLISVSIAQSRPAPLQRGLDSWQRPGQWMFQSLNRAQPLYNLYQLRLSYLRSPQVILPCFNRSIAPSPSTTHTALDRYLQFNRSIAPSPSTTFIFPRVDFQFQSLNRAQPLYNVGGIIYHSMYLCFNRSIAPSPSTTSDAYLHSLPYIVSIAQSRPAPLQRR